uniref:Uncharacterized protein n=1 Tax=Anguilla anguilla TaxID=7936 RepID=A0A0E9RZS7_ANGAN
MGLLQPCPSLHGHGLLQPCSSPAHSLTQPGVPDLSPGSSKLHYTERNNLVFEYSCWLSPQL